MDDEQEANAILSRWVAELRKLPYAELRDRFLLDEPVGGDPSWQEVRESSGTTYWLKTYAYWDSDDRDNLRVFVDIDDGSRRWFHQLLGADFIVAPDGSFVGE